MTLIHGSVIDRVCNTAHHLMHRSRVETTRLLILFDVSSVVDDFRCLFADFAGSSDSTCLKLGGTGVFVKWTAGFISSLWGMFSEPKLLVKFRSSMVHSLVFHVQDCFAIPENHFRSSSCFGSLD